MKALIPRDEWLTPLAFRLHLAERHERHDRLRLARWLLVISLAILACIPLISAPVVVERVASSTLAYARACQIARTCPWPKVYVRPVQGTQSMWPILDEGCWLVMARKPWDEVTEGDISSNRKVLHRLAAKLRARHGAKVYITKGDNNNRVDGVHLDEATYYSTVYAVVRFKDVPWSEPITLAQWNQRRK